MKQQEARSPRYRTPWRGLGKLLQTLKYIVNEMGKSSYC